MKKYYLSLLFLLFISPLLAQQVSAPNHEFYKPMIFNPAYTGNGEYTNTMIISRSQWIDFKNAPQLNLFTLDGMLPNNKMGLGIQLFSDKKGISNKIGGNICYSYQLLFNDYTKLKFGIALGMMDHILQYSMAVIEDASDPYLVGTGQKETSINANAGLGFVWKKLELGVSVPQLLGNALEYQDNTYGKANYSLTQHYQGFLKYQISLSKEKQISLTPLAITHFIPNAHFQYDANVTLDWKDKFWIGATYKSDYAISANAGICIAKKIAVGYSYDFIIGKVGTHAGMSHEIMLSFMFGKKKENAAPPFETANTEKTDSLKTELEIRENKIRSDQSRIDKLDSELAKIKEENEKLKKASAEGNNNVVSNQNTDAATTNQTKTVENGVMISSVTINDFIFLDGRKAKKGFYVITGTFLNRNLAENELKRIQSQGFSSGTIIHSPSALYNYVVASFYSNKEDAKVQVAKMKSGEFINAWIISVK